MSSRARIVGFDRKLELSWLDAMAARVARGGSHAEVRAYLWKLLEGSVSAGSSGFNSDRGKTITVLAHIWSEVPDVVRPLRDRALGELANADPEARLGIHWAMCLATYPFFKDVATMAGRLLALQGAVPLADARRHLIETWGDRTITRNASQRILRCFVAWGVLTDTEGKRGVYGPAPGKRRRVADGAAEVLAEGLLRAVDGHLLQAADLAAHPALFPFDADVSIPALRRSSVFVVQREGLDMDTVRLHDSERRRTINHAR